MARSELVKVLGGDVTHLVGGPSLFGCEVIQQPVCTGAAFAMLWATRGFQPTVGETLTG
jgi:hypothetical protein